jgi:hypothetical protein
MHATPPSELLRRARPSRETLLWGAVLVFAELLVVLVYVVLARPQLTSGAALRYYVYPFVWINVALWAVVRTRPVATTARRRRTAATIAVGYMGVLAYFGGLVTPSAMSATGVRIVTSFPPGWGPALVYDGAALDVVLLPFKLVGYAALSYLLYATVLEAAGSAVSGLLGLLSCVSCTWPILASIATGVVGSGTAIASAVYAQSYGLSTVVFVVTVLLLYWRPTLRSPVIEAVTP